MQNDFSKGKISRNILLQVFPLLAAQLMHLLYNVVDRMYIGHLDGIGSAALTGIGICFPITTIIGAFTNLFGSGGAPIFAIARGAKDEEKAERILSQVFSMLLICSVVIFVLSMLFKRPLLYAFGASDDSYAYAKDYLQIYLWGTTAAMLLTGLNGFINAQGFPTIGMLTTVLGAAMNLILDPIFIFVFHMGVSGAALATVLSQLASCVWVLFFFFGKKTLYRIRRKYLIPRWDCLKEVVGLGTANFVMGFTNTAVNVVCNVTLRGFGDLYVGMMTIINSVREIASLPLSCIPAGAQPVISFNYGARQYSRVRSAIRFIFATSIIYSLIAWLFIFLFPGFWISIFTNDTSILEAGGHCLKLYFFGFFFMAFQTCGQTCFTAMKYSKHAIFFSLLRKAFIVVPLTMLLPILGFGVDGVFLAEPISNALGGLACATTMFFTVYRKLPQQDGQEMIR